MANYIMMKPTEPSVYQPADFLSNYYKSPIISRQLLAQSFKEVYINGYGQSLTDSLLKPAHRSFTPLYLEVTDTVTNKNIVTFRLIHNTPTDGSVGWYFEKLIDGVVVSSVFFSTNIPYENYDILSQIINFPGNSLYDIKYHFSTLKGEYAITGSLAVVSNRLPLKKWTITDVINRTFDLIEPLRLGQRPRFRFDGVSYDANGDVIKPYAAGSQAEEFDDIIAPEYAFTKMTLREMLKQVGGYIHGEPRITCEKTDEFGDKYFEVKFDMYGGKKVSGISKRKCIAAGFNTNINDYCTALDSSADNLVSQLDFAQGVVVEPFYNGFRSVRCVSATLRMEENENTYIATDRPLYQVGQQFKVYCTVDFNEVYDITPYIFEKADYDYLSSYDGIYPYSKAYALYYEQGQPDIKGLFFKSPDAISLAFKDYAILNILKTVSGNNNIMNGKDYMELGFRVMYLPIYSTRIKTNKQTVVGGLPRSLAYDQNANLIETRYYGENLKGVVARLGNVEKTYTYKVPFLSDLPKTGMLFDEQYYISTVSVEVLPYHINVTVGLSKDFNRLSQYVGINSNKRMWEVSEKQSFERQSAITDYIVATERPMSADEEYAKNDTAIKRKPTEVLFNRQHGGRGQVTCAVVRTSEKDLSVIKYVSLPAVSTAFGNSMLFSFSFADNYSAGQKSVKPTGTEKRWGDYVSYCNYYGRFYYTTFDLLSGNVAGDKQSIAYSFPDGLLNPETTDGRVVALGNLRYRKDSREVPQINYQIAAVAEDESIIIGSAMTKNSYLVNAEPLGYELYGFYERLNPIDGRVDYTKGTKLEFTVSATGISIDLPNRQEDFKSWAIITEPSDKSIEVEDDDGNELTQTIRYGGELVIGQNKALKGQSLYFYRTSDIYKERS